MLSTNAIIFAMNNSIVGGKWNFHHQSEQHKSHSIVRRRRRGPPTIPMNNPYNRPVANFEWRVGVERALLRRSNTQDIPETKTQFRGIPSNSITVEILLHPPLTRIGRPILNESLIRNRWGCFRLCYPFASTCSSLFASPLPSIPQLTNPAVTRNERRIY